MKKTIVISVVATLIALSVAYRIPKVRSIITG